MRTHPLLLAPLAISLLAPPAAAQAPAAQAPAAQATAVPELPCPQTGGLQIGQARPDAFRMMARKDVTNDVTLLHAPEGRAYKVDVTFASASPTATIVKLRYVFNPPAGLLQGILDRYGKPTTIMAEHAAGTWEIPSCQVMLRYKMQETAEHKPLQEEMWVEPLPSRAPGAQAPGGKAAPPSTPAPSGESKKKG